MVQLVTDHRETHFKCVPLTAEQLMWQNVALYNVVIASNLHCSINRICDKSYTIFSF
jgi:hypothetical protein